MPKYLLYLIGLALMIAGCSGTIHRTDRISGNGATVIAVDARQRFLLSQPDLNHNPSATDPAFRRFCLEPSPDVFTVLGVAASGSGSLGLDKDAKTLNAAIQAAFSSSETGTTIPRTQTLNMLREMMFRTCERYLSGAISEIELPIVAIRDQRVMVSILAIEQLTGAVTPKPVVISNGGSAGTGQNATEIMKLVAKAKEELDIANEGVATATTASTTADAGAGVGGCTKLEKDKEDGKTVDAAKLKACTDAASALAAATDTRDDADAYYKQQAKIATTSQGVSSATTAAGPATDPKGWTLAQAQAVSGVAQTVKDIVHETFDQDETQFFCFKQISDSKLAANVTAIEKESGIAAENSVRAECLKYIIQKVKADSAMQQGRAQAALDTLGLSDTEKKKIIDDAENNEAARRKLAKELKQCLSNDERKQKIIVSIKDDENLKPLIDKFKRILTGEEADISAFLIKLTELQKTSFNLIVNTTCKGN